MTRAKKVIHVNMHVIRKNIKCGLAEPPITVRYRGKVVRATEVVTTGRLVFAYRPDSPLSCGARLWAETYDEVVADGVVIGQGPA